MNQGSPCVYCKKTSDKLFQCRRCKAVKYCSRYCQEKDYSRHKLVCRAVGDLERIEQEKLRRSCEDRSSSNKQARVVELVGGECQVACVIGGRHFTGLWDK